MKSHKKLEIGSTVQQVWSGNKYKVLALNTGVDGDYSPQEVPSDTHFKAEVIEREYKAGKRSSDKVGDIFYLTYEALENGWTIIL